MDEIKPTTADAYQSVPFATGGALAHGVAGCPPCPVSRAWR